MKLGFKIILPLLLLIVIISGSLFYLLYNLRLQEQNFTRNTAQTQKLNVLIEQLNRQQYLTEFNILAYNFNPDKSFLDLITQADLEGARILDEMSIVTSSSKGRELVKNFIDSKRNVVKTRSELINAIADNNKANTELYFSKWSIQIQNIRGNLADINAFNINSIDGTLLSASNLRNQISQIVIALIIISVITIILLYWFFNQSVVKPITRLSKATEAISNSDFTNISTTTIDINSKDEVGILADSFRKMAVNLKESYSGLEEKVKQRTSELEQAKAKDDAILAGIGDGLVATDKNGIIISINEKAKTLLDIKDNVMGEKFTDIASIEDEKGQQVNESQRPLAQVLSTGKLLTTIIYYYNRKGGTRFPVAITVSPVLILGKLEGVVEVFRDISHEKEVDRMKTEFISLASHQLRTPLSAMKWFSEMLLAGDAGLLQPEQKEYIQNIYDSNERMVALVNSLLNISRIESGRLIVEPKLTNLKTLVDQVITEVKSKVQEKKMQIIVSTKEDLNDINIDPKLIAEVYANLLTNAIKYTPEGGEITVFISKKEQEIISQVSDNGMGIPLTQQQRVFTKFFRADNAIKTEGEGTGLGLYLIKAIVESSGGKIWFKSEEGKGTSFFFSLPIAGSIAKKGEVSLNT